MPTFSDLPKGLKNFNPYDWQTARNQILAKLLISQGSVVGSMVEFVASEAHTLQVVIDPKTNQKAPVQEYKGLTLHANKPQLHCLLRFDDGGLSSPYHTLKGDAAKYQPLILRDKNSAHATLLLENERLAVGPFHAEPFAKNDPFEVLAFRYFAKSRDRLKQLTTIVKDPSTGLSDVDKKNLAVVLAIPEIGSVLDDLDDSIVVDGKNDTILNLLWRHGSDSRFHPEWATYATSPARLSHHLHKTNERLSEQYRKLDELAQGKKKQNLTEARGEYLASKIMTVIFRSGRYELKLGYGDKTGFTGIDQIWAQRDRKTNEICAYLIVECKGGKGASYGHNKDETQMSPVWMFKKLIELARDEDPRLQVLAQKLLAAMFNTNNNVSVFGMTVKSIFDDNNKSGTESRFNLQISTALKFSALLDVANNLALTLAKPSAVFADKKHFPDLDVANFSIEPFLNDPELRTTVLKEESVPSWLRFSDPASVATLDQQPIERRRIEQKQYDQRNEILQSILASQASLITSVHDYEGITAQTVKIGTNGKVERYQGLIAVTFDGDQHEHHILQSLQDRFDKPKTPGMLILDDLENNDEAKNAIALTRGNLRDANAVAEPWMPKLEGLRLLGAFKDGYKAQFVRAVRFFAKRPRARELLKICARASDYAVAFPLFMSDLFERSFAVNGGTWTLSQFVARLKGDGSYLTSPARMQHHEEKSLARLKHHYDDLDKTLDGKGQGTLSEVRGEMLAAKAMALIFGKDSLQLKMGHGEKTGSHGIDQIWVKRDAKSGNVAAFFIVECKGSKLAKQGQTLTETQMSPAWIFRSLVALEQDSGRLRRLARRVLHAMFDADGSTAVYGVTVQSLSDTAAVNARFNLQITSRLHYPDLLVLADRFWFMAKDRERDEQVRVALPDKIPLSFFMPNASTKAPKPDGKKPAPFKPIAIGLSSGGPKPGHRVEVGYPLTDDHVEELRRLRLTTIPIDPDGDCAFTSVIEILKLTEPGKVHTVASLRQEVSDDVDNYGTLLQQVAGRVLTAGEIKQLKIDVRGSGNFFGLHGDIALPFMCKRHNLRIAVINPNGGIQELWTSFADIGPTSPTVYHLVLVEGTGTKIPHYYATQNSAAPPIMVKKTDGPSKRPLPIAAPKKPKVLTTPPVAPGRTATPQLKRKLDDASSHQLPKKGATEKKPPPKTDRDPMTDSE